MNISHEMKDRILEFRFPGETLSDCCARLLAEQIDVDGIDPSFEYEEPQKTAVQFVARERDRELLDAQERSTNLLARDLIWSRLQGKPTQPIENADEFYQWLLSMGTELKAMELADAVPLRCSMAKAAELMDELIQQGKVDPVIYQDYWRYDHIPEYTRKYGAQVATTMLTTTGAQHSAFIVKEKSPCLSV